MSKYCTLYWLDLRANCIWSMKRGVSEGGKRDAEDEAHRVQTKETEQE